MRLILVDPVNSGPVELFRRSFTEQKLTKKLCLYRSEHKSSCSGFLREVSKLLAVDKNFLASEVWLVERDIFRLAYLEALPV